MYKQNSEYKSIQKKLVAAVAMVLVACIMVVSSSYAWFTLSTAPEVQGITTAVGSNGNLEMALRQTGVRLEDIMDAIGTQFPSSNNFWGNLIDLDYDEYGMEQIALAPARLNAAIDSSKTQNVKYTVETTKALTYKVGDTFIGVTTDMGAATAVAGNNAKISNIVEKKFNAAKEEITETTTDKVAVKYQYTITTTIYAYKLVTGSGYLKVPKYGADGRVQSLEADTINGIFNAEDNAFAELQNSLGVRAIGVTSDITPEALALLNAKRAVRTAISEARDAAAASLRNDAAPMANLIIQNMLKAQAYDNADYLMLGASIEHLEAIADQLEEALKYAVVAVGLSQGKSFETNDVTFTAIGVSSTYTPVIAVAVDGKAVTLDWDAVVSGNAKTELDKALTSLNTILVDINGASTEYGKIKNENAPTDAQVTAVMAKLLSTNDVNVIQGGKTYTASALKDMGVGAAMILIDSSTVVSLVDGIYYDIGTFCGAYEAAKVPMTVDTKGTGYEDQIAGVPGVVNGVVSINLNMAVNPQIPTGCTNYYLEYIKNWMGSLTVVGGTASTLITDIYGYVLDFAFRTNAKDSSLLLQTLPVDRVTDNGEESSVTMGHGSYMEFTAGNGDFTLAQVVNLMGSIRVVFTNDAGEILAIGALDVTTAEDILVDGSVVAFDETKHALYRAGGDGEPEKVAQTLTNGLVNSDTQTVRAFLYLYGYTFDGNGVLELGSKLPSSAISTLQKNVAEDVSVLVYLDGDEVGNEDVAISGNSMNGTMNLQFASSADLIPMEYTFTDGSTETTAPSVPNVTLGEGPSLAWDNTTPTSLRIGAVENAVRYIVIVDDDTDNPNTVNNIADPYPMLNVLNDGKSHTIKVTAVAANGDVSKTTSITYTP